MAANNNPIFTLTPNINSVLVTAANTSSQGGGTVATDIFKAFTAGVNGSYVEKIRVVPTATAPTATTATVARIFVSNVTAGATTSANTFLVWEGTLPIVNADNASSGVDIREFPFQFYLPASWTILVTNHAAPAASTAWRFVVFGGDY
jgi:hypothetical protein